MKKHYKEERNKLSAAKKEFDYKKLKLSSDYDYTSDEEEDAKLKLDEETKNLIGEINKKEKGVDKKGFSEYFNYKPSALVSKVLTQNIQDLKKSLNKIKQQKIKLDSDERNSINMT